MKKLHPLVIVTLIFMFATSSIHGQDPCYQPCNQEDEYSSAYMQSSHTAHWSVYIPIALLVGAAVLFGLADRKHDDHDKSVDSKDGLGSIADPKRQSHHSYNNYSYGSRFRRLNTQSFSSHN